MDLPLDAPRPSYSELTEAQKKLICNGVGSDWTPDFIRNALTKMSRWFFNDASWCHHDFGYSIGHTEKHRYLYDRKFLEAMLSDASQFDDMKYVIALLLSYIFYFSVRSLGWIGFHYGERYRTLEEVLAIYAE